MTVEPFSIEFVQAVNDWQRGGDANQKRRRGQQLKKLAALLPQRYRQADLCCFRQIALDKQDVFKLHDNLYLTETISSWTFSTEVAKELKGGVPPEGQGVIFELVPPPGSVVVNLFTLYNDPDFRECYTNQHAAIIGFGDGIHRYGNSQVEVVLEIESVPVSAIYAYGGNSSSREVIASRFFGHEPTDDEWKWFDELLSRSQIKLGPNWLCGDAKDRVIDKALATVEQIKEHKKP